MHLVLLFFYTKNNEHANKRKAPRADGWRQTSIQLKKRWWIRLRSSAPIDKGPCNGAPNQSSQHLVTWFIQKISARHRHSTGRPRINLTPIKQKSNCCWYVGCQSHDAHLASDLCLLQSRLLLRDETEEGWTVRYWMGWRSLVLLADVFLEESERAHRVLQRCSSAVLLMANIVTVGSNSRPASMSSPMEKPLPGGVGRPILVDREAGRWKHKI